MDELQRVLDLQPNYDDAYELMGQIFASRGDIDSAASVMRKAIEIRPNFWGHYRSLGRVFLRAGRFPEAVEEFQRAKTLQPERAIVYQSLGVTFHMMGDLDNAISNYEKSNELSPNTPSLNNLAMIYYRQGKLAEARRDWFGQYEEPWSARTIRSASS